MTPVFFANPADWRRWLQANHATSIELVVGFHKKETGRPSLTWPESVAEALCYGWIDGIRRSLGAEAYTIRFTPRKPTSIWSDVNTRMAKRLIADGRMEAAGLAAFKRRDAKRSGVYSFERKQAAELIPAERKGLKAEKAAWKFWEAQPPGYRNLVCHWLRAAKREETRAKRFARLLDDCRNGLRIKELRR